MRTRAIFMLGLALLLAGASVYLARNWIQTQIQANARPEQQAPVIETVDVVVAAGDLFYGNKLRREHLLLIDWPKTSVPEGAFHSVEEILGDKNGKDANGQPVDDRVVLRTIAKNEPILRGKITGFGGRASLSTLLSPGMRATTIRVNDVAGVAGFVLPGDRVDILITRDPSASGASRRGGDNLVTEILLQNMKVLGIDQDANEDRTKPGVARAVTLEVTTVQAQKLTLAQKLGDLSLALRHVNTVDAEKPTTVTARDLRVGEVNQAPDGKLSAATIVGDEPAPVVADDAEKTVATKKAVVTKTVTSKRTTKDMASVRIVRGLKAAEYEVSPEKPSFSAPAYSKPLNLLPTKIAPSVAPVAPMPGKLDPKLDPAAGGGDTNGGLPGGAPAPGTMGTSLSGAAPSEPISLLKNGRSLGDDG